MNCIRPDWPAPAKVRALCTTRGGGVSTGPFTSLNLGLHVGDDPAAVSQNRQRLREQAGLPAEPLWLNQVHGTTVADATALHGEVPEADAAVARQPAQVCAIMTADCLPLLLANRAGDCVAAAHAGWRGLAAGVIARTVERMACPPAELLAWLGPAIGPDAFEVGEEVRQAFMQTDTGADVCFQPRDGRWRADLYGLARRQLQQLGVDGIYGGGFCTHTDAARFFSYRRDGDCGRMASLIWLEA